MGDKIRIVFQTIAYILVAVYNAIKIWKELHKKD